SAARTYFDTTPDQLTPEQAATLVGMLKGTYIYSPVRFPENSIRRRNTVLNNMVDQNFMTKEEGQTAKEQELNLKLRIANYGEGMATFYRAVLKVALKKEYKRLAITNADGTPYDLDRGGVRVCTSINDATQQYAEEAQQEWMEKLLLDFDRRYRNTD